MGLTSAGEGCHCVAFLWLGGLMVRVVPNAQCQVDTKCALVGD